jgi:hypothetical protein
MIARAGALALACSLLFLAPASAGATNVTDAQLRTLATQASTGDPTALAQLRAVDAVDGQPANINDALNTSDPAALRSRLQALATPASGAAPDAGQAQASAASVLHQRQYGRAPLPDPIGTAFNKVGHFLAKLASNAPGGPVVFWLVLAVLVLAGAGFGARRMLRRLDPATRTARLYDGGAAESPDALMRKAAAAEARGAFGEAIRLRFQAGLLTLGERGRLDYRPSLLTGEARRTLHSRTFDDLAAHFEQVAYADAPADAEQAAAARDGWDAVLTTEERW